METPAVAGEREGRTTKLVPDAGDDARGGEDGGGDRSGLATGVKNGAIGGFLATVTMTVYRLPIARSLPPTSEFWGQYGPGEDDAGPILALLLHLGYGTGGGIAFAAAFARLGPGSDSDAKREVASLVAGLLYGAVLSLFGSRVLLRRVLGMDLEADEVLVFHVSHLIYAATLATWVGSRLRRGE